MLEVFEFGKDERDRRWTLVRNAMKQRGISVLVIWGFAGYNSVQCGNFRYLSNMATFGNLSYPGYLVFPLDGEPTIIGYAKMPAADSLWVQDIRGKIPSYSKAIIDRLHELHLEKAGIGVVSFEGSDAEEGFPYATFSALKEGLPGAAFQDAAEILADIRRIKSEGEIRCLELGCVAAGEAIQAVVDTARAGVRDCEVVAKILDILTRNGCETDALFLYGSGKEYIDAGKGVFVYPRHLRMLEKGDIIHMEFDAKYNGYVAQLNQMFAVGKPSKDWLDVAKVDAMAYENGLKALKPGITLAGLNKSFLSVIKEAGYDSERLSFHGLGLSTEKPMASSAMTQTPCVPSDSFKMMPGMVLEFEPHAMTKDRKFSATQGCPVLVTETGCRPLYKNRIELRICGK